MHRVPRLRVRVVVASLVLALVTAWSATAGAHTAPVGSAPAEGAALDAPPARVVVRFSQPLGAASEARVRVDGRDVAGSPALDAADRRRLVIPLTGGGAGAYSVSWTVVAADGHSVAGDTAFTVRAAPAPAGLVAVGARMVSVARAVQRSAARLAG